MLIFLKLLVSFTLIFTTGNGQKVDLSKQKDLILKLHNGYRGLQGASNMKKMRWSDKLAREAEKWVGRCWYQFLAGTSGENMFYLESALPDQVLIERAIDTWYSEKYGWRRSGDCTDACSYTQMVWAKSSEIGCAAYRCASLNLPTHYALKSWFFICHYSPKGNTLGQMPFEAGNPCTLCDLGERCMDKLCVKSGLSRPRVSVQNRRPPRPRVKPILSFDDVQKQKRANLNQRTDLINNPAVTVPTPPTPPPNPLLCPDSDSNCKHWKQYCSTNDHVAKNCPGTCDTCPTPPPDPVCPDLDPSCHLWATYCAHNDYVRDHCFNTCNNCTYAVHGNTHMGFGHGFHHSVTPPANGLMALPLQSTTSTTAAPCIDKDQYCSGWKNLCYTDEYVKFNCKKSCTFCK